MIGEHTDYNDGFVLPAAIDKEAVFATRLNGTRMIRIFANDLDQSFETEISDIKPNDLRWPNYLLGVVDQLNKMKYTIPGFDCVFGSDIPIGAGLSSSAALECAMAFSLNELLHFGLSKIQLAKLSQTAEQEFAGVKCGIMDEFTSLFGLENHVIKLDCRSLEFQYFPLILKDLEIILCDTKVKHALASSEYNTRRKECEQGVFILRKYDDSIHSLRDVKPETVKDHQSKLPDPVFRRCLFVTEEIGRVEAACIDLEKADMNAFGEKMYETHTGLSKMYEVSCPELDFMVEIALESRVVAGARMMGGGFGGCTINLVDNRKVDQFVTRVKDQYKRKMKIDPAIYRVQIMGGTSVVSDQ
jgi:galactokinase